MHWGILLLRRLVLLHLPFVADRPAALPVSLPLMLRFPHPLPPAGPVWKPPRALAVLQAHPFLQPLPHQLLKQVLAAGSIRGAWRPCGSRVDEGEKALGGAYAGSGPTHPPPPSPLCMLTAV